MEKLLNNYLIYKSLKLAAKLLVQLGPNIISQDAINQDQMKKYNVKMIMFKLLDLSNLQDKE